jgi:hypothetical protein
VPWGYVKKNLLLIGVLALCGCVNMETVKAPPDALSSLQGSSLTTVTYVKPSFTALTYGDAMFGAIGGIAAVSNGDRIIRDNQVSDPAETIAAKLSPIFAARLKTATSNTLSGQMSDAAASLSTAAGSKGVIFDVETTVWMFGYFPFDWTHYHVTYNARARLIDASSGKVIGQVPCKVDTGEDKQPPTYDQLLDNKANLLKTKLASAADTCASLIENAMLPPG